MSEKESSTERPEDNNLTAFVQFLRETTPEVFGREGVGSEAEEPYQFTQAEIHDLFEQDERLSVASAHYALFHLMPFKPEKNQPISESSK